MQLLSRPVLKPGLISFLPLHIMEGEHFISQSSFLFFSFRRLIENEIDELSPELPGILRSASVDVRLAASEAAAVCSHGL